LGRFFLIPSTAACLIERKLSLQAFAMIIGGDRSRPSV
jgi:hypothetical protein